MQGPRPAAVPSERDSSRPWTPSLVVKKSVPATFVRNPQQPPTLLTNKQIAQALFVTLRTIEMHLSNAYGKLEIDSRQDLAKALAA
jgi:hypothetical protein